MHRQTNSNYCTKRIFYGGFKSLISLLEYVSFSERSLSAWNTTSCIIGFHCFSSRRNFSTILHPASTVVINVCLPLSRDSISLCARKLFGISSKTHFEYANQSSSWLLMEPIMAHPCWDENSSQFWRIWLGRLRWTRKGGRGDREAYVTQAKINLSSENQIISPLPSSKEVNEFRFICTNLDDFSFFIFFHSCFNIIKVFFWLTKHEKMF